MPAGQIDVGQVSLNQNNFVMPNLGNLPVQQPQENKQLSMPLLSSKPNSVPSQKTKSPCVKDAAFYDENEIGADLFDSDEGNDKVSNQLQSFNLKKKPRVGSPSLTHHKTQDNFVNKLKNT